VLVVGNVEVLKRGAGAGQARLAGHLRLVDPRGERLRGPCGPVADVAPVGLHQLAQRLAPRLLVRRVDQDSVDVEDRSLERGSAGCAHGLLRCGAAATGEDTSKVSVSPGHSSRTSSPTPTRIGP